MLEQSHLSSPSLNSEGRTNIKAYNSICAVLTSADNYENKLNFYITFTGKSKDK